MRVRGGCVCSHVRVLGAGSDRELCVSVESGCAGWKFADVSADGCATIIV